jgi:transcriptional regulator with XRE-family HTH domain
MPKKQTTKLRPVEEREPVRAGLQLFRERMGWTQTDAAVKLGKSFQSQQKYEQIVPEEILSFCIAEANRKGWHDIAFMLGAPGTRIEGEPTTVEQQTINRVLLACRRGGKEFTAELDKLLAYFESSVRKR